MKTKNAINFKKSLTVLGAANGLRNRSKHSGKGTDE